MQISFVGRALVMSCAGFLGLMAVPAQAQQPFTLADAIARVLQNNPELAADLPARDAARSEERATRAGYLPRVDFELNYNGGDNPVYAFGTLLTQRKFTQANFDIAALNMPPAIDNVQTRITAQQTIYDFGRTRERRQQAALAAELADRGYEEHRRRTILAAIHAYLSVSMAQEDWQAARAALESAESIARQAQARVANGLAVEADLLRAQASAAAARQQEIQARAQLETARAALNRLMGQPLDAPQGETARLVPANLPLPSEEALAAGQRAGRADYQALLAEVRLAEAQLRSRREEFYPILAGFASWETDNPSWADYGGQNWLAGISLRWNLFAGGADRAQLEAARHRLDQKRRLVTAMESGMELELRSALVQTRSAAEQVEASGAAERQSEESLRILRNRYEAGLATMTDLLSAETARAAARAARADAVARHRLSYAQLEFVSGLLSPTSTATQP